MANWRRAINEGLFSLSILFFMACNSNGSLIIDRPVTNPFETGEASLTFNGRAPANTHHVTWENQLTGESGNTNDPPGTEWGEGIGLFEGANTIIFKAWDASNQLLDEASIVVNRRNNIRQVDAGCVGHCWISSSHPQQHLTGEMYVGWDTNDGYLAERGLIMFTLPGLPAGSSISNASFGARTSSLAYCAPNWPLNISIARITSNWNLSSVCWNDQPNYTEEDMSGAGIPPGHKTWSYWDATGIVQDWYHGANNYGMILIADSEGGNRCEERAFDYHDFRLWINYVYPHADITGDGRVDMQDLLILSEQWLATPGLPSADIAPDGGDGGVNLLDWAILAQEWLW